MSENTNTENTTNEEEIFLRDLVEVRQSLAEQVGKLVEIDKELYNNTQALNNAIAYTLDSIFKLKNRDYNKNEALDFISNDIMNKIVPLVCNVEKMVSDVVKSSQEKGQTECNNQSKDFVPNLKQAMFDELMYVASTKEQRNEDELQSIAESFKRVLDKVEQ